MNRLPASCAPFGDAKKREVNKGSKIRLHDAKNKEPHCYFEKAHETHQLWEICIDGSVFARGTADKRNDCVVQYLDAKEDLLAQALIEFKGKNIEEGAKQLIATYSYIRQTLPSSINKSEIFIISDRFGSLPKAGAGTKQAIIKSIVDSCKKIPYLEKSNFCITITHFNKK